MERCIDCNKKFSCGKANSKITCEQFERMWGTVTKLNKKDGEYFEFERITDESDKCR